MYREDTKAGQSNLIGFIFIQKIKIGFSCCRHAVSFTLVRTLIPEIVRPKSIHANVII